MIWSRFGSKKGAADVAPATASMSVAWDRGGVRFQPEPKFESWLSSPMSFGGSSELALLLRQLEEEGFAELDDGGARLSWDDFFKLQSSPEHSGAIGLLGLPPQEAWTPILSSAGTLTDKRFAVSIQGWLDPKGQRPNGNVDIVGAVLTAGSKSAILPEAAWRMAEAVAEQRRRKPEERAPDVNKRDWSAIRGHASRAGADLTDYLRRTVVLTPERLRIDLRKGNVAGDKLVEVMPGFDGAPARWMEMFDRLDTVPERYEISDGNELVHVLLTPETRAVLREIRKMPGRRIAGDRAEAFLRNPFATLGPDASKVIDPAQFEKARDDAGVSFARFTARVRRDEKGYPYDCALLVEETIHGEFRSEDLQLEGPQNLEKFVAKLEARIAASAQCCHWQGYDLEILGDAPDQAKLLREALRDMSAPGSMRTSEIFDLSRYSERVEGFGVEKPYYSPFIARKSEDAGWFPENVDFGLCYTPKGGGETVAIMLTDDSIADLREQIRKAQEEKLETIDLPDCSKLIPVAWAAEALDMLGKARKDVSKHEFDPKKPATKTKAIERKGLVVKPNVNQLDYEEERRGALTPTGAPPRLPTSLLPNIALKDHQLSGVAWLQHLWNLSPMACRGALLADDMGLGKTIQLLTFIAAAIEEQPNIDPFLVVAPVSLLENWKEEVAKFFAPGAMRVLTLYGPALAEKRVPKRSLDEELVQGGATRLLSPGWLGGAQVVLTTYETLRDLEFSLAAQRWSAMICDEAQKIKNPNALVTRAAKKQNAQLKIACTGTPVENTLTDIWCLFDFVQPGLLGALKEFGNLYRRPIEAEGDADAEMRVAELRALIAPQKLRRTKAEVAKDLPKKIEVDACRALPLSDRQRTHYADAVAAFRKREKDSLATGLQSPLGLLQYLRRLCSDPRPPGHVSTDSESVADIERRSPKMAWLLAQLREIEAKDEKAIVFCEFRDLQRTLQRAIGERFGAVPDVINGDTSADSANANNRQRRIKKFQDKPGFGVIVLSPLAVGFGVNIQAANHVVHFTRTWNPAKEDQATDRAYRIGQTRDVHVYYPVVVAHDFLTFDAKLDKLLDWKRTLSTDMLNGAGDVSPADFGDLEAPDGGNAFAMSASSRT
ncbi:DEAD/DEAH box helicase [Verminephrobacter aporrectodeae]|uniref:DEAD/DEAH box helicase n=1 Tax=Verminephrobacter aporrectodeae TaxID=1110389 RepID=UPI002243D31D|nr:DEAD/DEAH box helicase [Verminephrobacter aporrectodeae]